MLLYQLKIVCLWLRYRWAARAVERPFDEAASLRLDQALVRLEKALAGVQ